MPYNLVRTWHVQLALLWVSTSFLAAGIFLVPMISRRRDPKGQGVLAYGLLAALAVVVVGSLAGEAIGIHGGFGDAWAWLGMQGFEYLDLGKLWQILLTVGMVFWVALLWRGLRGRLAEESRANMPWMFFFAALALPVAAVGLHRLGRVNSSPWASRVLSAYRRQVLDASMRVPPARSEGPEDWPHTEARRLYTGIALVAAAAALLLAVVELVRHHRPAEAVPLACVVVVALALLSRLRAAI